jgi:hypothetical protein
MIIRAIWTIWPIWGASGISMVVPRHLEINTIWVQLSTNHLVIHRHAMLERYATTTINHSKQRILHACCGRRHVMRSFSHLTDF